MIWIKIPPSFAAPCLRSGRRHFRLAKGNVLKEVPAYTCFPREGGGHWPMCVDEVWAGWLEPRCRVCDCGEGCARVLR